MKLKEAFAKPTYRSRQQSPHYAVAVFKNDEFQMFQYDEDSKPVILGFPSAAQDWINTHDEGFLEDVNQEWRVLEVDIIPRKT